MSSPITESEIAELEALPVYEMDDDACQCSRCRIVRAFPRLAAAAREGLQQRWIPVSERLPERGAKVMLYSACQHCDRPHGMYGTDTCYTPHGEVPHFTHWMPLPEPPQANTDGGTGG